MNEKEVLKEVINICESNNFIEICGFIGYQKNSNEFLVEQQENISEDPAKFFLISPVNYLLFKDKVDNLIVFHSHPSSNEEPSEMDIKISDNCCDPFLIYSLVSKKIHIYNPKNSIIDVSILERLKEAI